jgi:hypothetical protein
MANADLGRLPGHRQRQALCNAGQILGSACGRPSPTGAVIRAAFAMAFIARG